MPQKDPLLENPAKQGLGTLGWPNETHDLEHLFPMSLLETGMDILCSSPFPLEGLAN